MLTTLGDLFFWEQIKAIKFGILLDKLLQKILFKKVFLMFTGDLDILINYRKNNRRFSLIMRNKSERDMNKWMTEE